MSKHEKDLSKCNCSDCCCIRAAYIYMEYMEVTQVRTCKIHGPWYQDKCDPIHNCQFLWFKKEEFVPVAQL